MARRINILSFVVSADTKRMQEGLNRGERSVRRFESNILRSLRRVSTTSTTIFASLATLTSFGGFNFIRKARELDVFARSVGVTVEEMDGLTRLFENAGLSASTAQDAIKTLTERIADAQLGTLNYLEAFRRLGIEPRRDFGPNAIDNLITFFSAAAERAQQGPRERRFAQFEVEEITAQNTSYFTGEVARLGREGVIEFIEQFRQGRGLLSTELTALARDVQDAFRKIELEAEEALGNVLNVGLLRNFTDTLLSSFRAVIHGLNLLSDELLATAAGFAALKGLAIVASLVANFKQLILFAVRLAARFSLLGVAALTASSYLSGEGAPLFTGLYDLARAIITYEIPILFNDVKRWFSTNFFSPLSTEIEHLVVDLRRFGRRLTEQGEQRTADDFDDNAFFGFGAFRNRLIEGAGYITNVKNAVQDSGRAIADFANYAFNGAERVKKANEALENFIRDAAERSSSRLDMTIEDWSSSLSRGADNFNKAIENFNRDVVEGLKRDSSALLNFGSTVRDIAGGRQQDLDTLTRLGSSLATTIVDLGSRFYATLADLVNNFSRGADRFNVAMDDFHRDIAESRQQDLDAITGFGSNLYTTLADWVSNFSRGADDFDVAISDFNSRIAEGSGDDLDAIRVFGSRLATTIADYHSRFYATLADWVSNFSQGADSFKAAIDSANRRLAEGRGDDLDAILGFGSRFYSTLSDLEINFSRGADKLNVTIDDFNRLVTNLGSTLYATLTDWVNNFSRGVDNFNAFIDNVNRRVAAGRGDDLDAIISFGSRLDTTIVDFGSNIASPIADMVSNFLQGTARFEAAVADFRIETAERRAQDARAILDFGSNFFAPIGDMVSNFLQGTARFEAAVDELRRRTAENRQQEADAIRDFGSRLTTTLAGWLNNFNREVAYNFFPTLLNDFRKANEEALAREDQQRSARRQSDDSYLSNIRDFFLNLGSDFRQANAAALDREAQQRAGRQDTAERSGLEGTPLERYIRQLQEGQAQRRLEEGPLPSIVSPTDQALAKIQEGYDVLKDELGDFSDEFRKVIENARTILEGGILEETNVGNQAANRLNRQVVQRIFHELSTRRGLDENQTASLIRVLEERVEFEPGAIAQLTADSQREVADAIRSLDIGTPPEDIGNLTRIITQTIASSQPRNLGPIRELFGGVARTPINADTFAGNFSEPARELTVELRRAPVALTEAITEIVRHGEQEFERIVGYRNVYLNQRNIAEPSDIYGANRFTGRAPRDLALDTVSNASLDIDAAEFLKDEDKEEITNTIQELTNGIFDSFSQALSYSFRTGDYRALGRVFVDSVRNALAQQLIDDAKELITKFFKDTFQQSIGSGNLIQDVAGLLKKLFTKIFELLGIGGIGNAFGGGGGQPELFHRGGVVPGPPGADIPIIAQAGETVLPAGVSPTNTQINLNFSEMSDEAFQTRLYRELPQITEAVRLNFQNQGIIQGA